MLGPNGVRYRGVPLYYKIIHYVTLLAYLLKLSQSQGGHFWRGRPARPHPCEQNKYTLVHTPLRGLSDSEIMAGDRGGKVEGGREEAREEGVKTPEEYTL